MRARTHKDDGVSIQAVDQKKVATDVAFTVVYPIALERVVQPFGAQRRVVANEQQHCAPSGASGPIGLSARGVPNL
jgi:hypothetical protein